MGEGDSNNSTLITRSELKKTKNIHTINKNNKKNKANQSALSITSPLKCSTFCTYNVNV